jgi:hypothetical protein
MAMVLRITVERDAALAYELLEALESYLPPAQA